MSALTITISHCAVLTKKKTRIPNVTRVQPLHPEIFAFEFLIEFLQFFVLIMLSLFHFLVGAGLQPSLKENASYATDVRPYLVRKGRGLIRSFIDIIDRFRCAATAEMLIGNGTS